MLPVLMVTPPALDWNHPREPHVIAGKTGEGHCPTPRKHLMILISRQKKAFACGKRTPCSKRNSRSSWLLCSAAALVQVFPTAFFLPDDSGILGGTNESSSPQAHSTAEARNVPSLIQEVTPRVLNPSIEIPGCLIPQLRGELAEEYTNAKPRIAVLEDATTARRRRASAEMKKVDRIGKKIVKIEDQIALRGGKVAEDNAARRWRVAARNDAATRRRKLVEGLDNEVAFRKQRLERVLDKQKIMPTEEPWDTVRNYCSDLVDAVDRRAGEAWCLEEEARMALKNAKADKKAAGGTFWKRLRRWISSRLRR